MKFDLLSSTPEVLGGKICIKNTRISVALILEFVASGASIKDIVSTYPYLQKEAIAQAILYAGKSKNFMSH